MWLNLFAVQHCCLRLSANTAASTAGKTGPVGHAQAMKDALFSWRSWVKLPLIGFRRARILHTMLRTFHERKHVSAV
jgi:hypothetical protein